RHVSGLSPVLRSDHGLAIGVRKSGQGGAKVPDGFFVREAGSKVRSAANPRRCNRTEVPMTRFYSFLMSNAAAAVLTIAFAASPVSIDFTKEQGLTVKVSVAQARRGADDGSGHDAGDDNGGGRGGKGGHGADDGPGHTSL